VATNEFSSCHPPWEFGENRELSAFAIAAALIWACERMVSPQTRKSVRGNFIIFDFI
jgi:hypothetical protein